MNTAIFNGKASMTSVEIAELVGKRHDNVKRTIETFAQFRRTDLLYIEYDCLLRKAPGRFQSPPFLSSTQYCHLLLLKKTLRFLIHTVSDCSHENNHILCFSRFPDVQKLLSEKWEQRLLRMDVPLQILHPREYIVFQIDNFLPCCLSLLLTFHSIKYSTFPQQNPDTLRMHPQDP